jgi:hypothetical protein
LGGEKTNEEHSGDGYEKPIEADDEGSDDKERESGLEMERWFLDHAIQLELEKVDSLLILVLLLVPPLLQTLIGQQDLETKIEHSDGKD